MSNQLSNKVSKQLHTLEQFQQMRTEFDKKTAEIRKEYESRTAEVNTELRNTIATYNAVASNTLNKFRADAELYSKVSAAVLIPQDAKLSTFNPYTGEYVFVSASRKTEHKIHHTLLCHDPIAVAQHVRKRIREQQAANRSKVLTQAYADQRKAKTVYANAVKSLDAVNSEVKRLEAAQIKRSEKALARKTRPLKTA